MLGVSLTNVTTDAELQLTMFGDEEREKSRTIDKTVDEIRNKFGSDTIVRGLNYKSDINVGKKHKAQMDDKSEE